MRDDLGEPTKPDTCTLKRDLSVPVACLCALAGAVLYALAAFGILFPLEYPYFGSKIYDAYYLRLLEGRFDLPMRMLRFEGHYTSDGTGILYHGFAPLLTRVVLHPFVTLGEFPTAAFSVWLWSVVGTGFYHAAIFQVIRKFAGPLVGANGVLWTVLTGVGVWVCAPGLLMSTNSVLYHEPISIAHAAMAIAVYLMVRCAFFGMPYKKAMIPAAIMGGILLLSRPHLAVGVYAGVIVLIILAFWQGSGRPFIKSICSLVILGAFAVSMLQLNAMRFGSATSLHGTFDAQDDDAVLYGLVFFGTQYAETGRGVVFREHGRFHAWRVLPNLYVYTLDHPALAETVTELHYKVTENISGRGFIENPRFGMLFIWTPWIVLMIAGLIFARPRLSGGVPTLPVLVTTGIAAGLLLSYPTVAFRYRFELWPLIITLCLLSFPGLMQRYTPNILQNRSVICLSVMALLTGMALSVLVLENYNQGYQEAPERTYRAWDVAECTQMLSKRDFTPEQEAALCIDPKSAFPSWSG